MMLSDVVTIKAALIGRFDEPQALLIQFIGRHSIAIDPIEDAKFDRRVGHRRKSLPNKARFVLHQVSTTERQVVSQLDCAGSGL